MSGLVFASFSVTQELAKEDLMTPSHFPSGNIKNRTFKEHNGLGLTSMSAKAGRAFLGRAVSRLFDVKRDNVGLLMNSDRQG